MRIAKYLKDLENQGIKQEFKFEALDTIFTAHTGSDWAGCRSSRTSTSGLGSPSTGAPRRRPVALSSSCEAELHAIHLKRTRQDLGRVNAFDIVLRTDASAALGVFTRRGVGKTRRIDTQELWLQSAMRNPGAGGAEGQRRGEREI